MGHQDSDLLNKKFYPNQFRFYIHARQEHSHEHFSIDMLAALNV